MAVDLDTLLVKLAADTSQMRGELAKATTAMAREMQKQAKEVERVNAALEKVGARIKQTIVGALSGLSVAKLASMTRESLKWAEATEQQARWIGLSTAALAAYEDGAKKAGVETGKMGQALEKMVGNLADAAADPNSGPAKIFKQLGLDVKQANADVDAFLGKLADKIQGLSKNDKLIVGKTLFGDKMDDVVRVFEGGAAGLAKMRAEFDKMNPGFADAVKRGAEMNRQYEAITTQIDRDLKQALIDLGPVLVYLVGLAASFARGFSEALKYAGAIKDTAASQLARAEGIVKLAKENPGAVPLGMQVEAQRSIPRLRKEAEAEKYFGSFSGGFVDPSKLPGSKKDIITTGSGGESELEKLLRRIKEEAVVARKELEYGPESAAWQKYYDDIDRLQATRKQRHEAYQNFIDTQDAKGLKVLKEFGQESEHVARIAAAEAMGRKDLVAVLELEFQLRQKFGDRFVAQNRAMIETQAKLRYEIERTRERNQAGMQALESMAENAFGNMTSALLDFSNTNETVWERLRNTGHKVLQELFNEMVKLALLNPLKNLVFNQNNPTLGGILSNIGGGGGTPEMAASGGGFLGGIGNILGGLFRAEGGPVTAGMPYIVGEKRPELFVPNVSGTIVPRVPTGGSVTLVGSDSNVVELRQVKQALRRLGHRVDMVDASVDGRAAAAVVDMQRRTN